MVDPVLYVYYDVVTDKEIEIMKKNALKTVSFTYYVNVFLVYLNTITNFINLYKMKCVKLFLYLLINYKGVQSQLKYQLCFRSIDQDFITGQIRTAVLWVKN